MLKELINSFYDENGFLKEELTVTFTQEDMIKMIKEAAELNLDLATRRSDEEINYAMQ